MMPTPFDSYTPKQPPEIREPQASLRVVEFWVHLGDPRPDIQLFELVTAWLRLNAPMAMYHLDISYQRRNEQEPDMMLGQLIVGPPVDVG